MIETIRYDTFETNSSSCHCISFVNSDKFEQFKNGELYIVFAPYGLSLEGVTKYQEETKKENKRYNRKYCQNTPCYLYTKEELYDNWLLEQGEYYYRSYLKTKYSTFNEYLYDYYRLDYLSINKEDFLINGMSYSIFDNNFDSFINGLNIYKFDTFIKNCYDDENGIKWYRFKKIFGKNRIIMDYYFRLT